MTLRNDPAYLNTLVKVKQVRLKGPPSTSLFSHEINRRSSKITLSFLPSKNGEPFGLHTSRSRTLNLSSELQQHQSCILSYSAHCVDENPSTHLTVFYGNFKRNASAESALRM